MEGFMHFEAALANANSWEERVRICLDGILNNIFYRGALLISRLDLETLRIRYPELYETIKDETVRNALIASELFKAKFGSEVLHRLGVEAPEIEMDEQQYHIWDFLGVVRQEEFSQTEGLYRGKDAVRVFLKSVLTLSEELYNTLCPILADPWRVGSGLEGKRDVLRRIMYEEFKRVVEGLPAEAKVVASSPEKAVDGMVYFLCHYYANVGERVKRRLKRIMGAGPG